MLRLSIALAVLAVLAAAGCRKPEPPAAAAASAASPAAASVSGASAPTAPVPPPPPGDVRDDFMRLNGVDRVVDSWVNEMGRQWHQQETAMVVRPGPRFWEESVAEFDMDAERRAVAEAVAAGISEAEMSEDVAWLRESGMSELSARLDALSAAVAPIHAALGAEGERAAARRKGRPEPPARPIVVPRNDLRPEDLAAVHGLMERLGYGAPAQLAPRLLDALRAAMPNEPEATAQDPALVAASRDAARAIEAEFIRLWPPAEARRVSELLDSPGGRRHDALMEKLTPLVMSRSQPFMESLQMHVLKRYARIFNVAWEEHERQKREAAP